MNFFIKSVLAVILCFAVLTGTDALAAKRASVWPCNGVLLDFENLDEEGQPGTQPFRRDAESNTQITAISDSSGDLMLVGLGGRVLLANEAVLTEFPLKSDTHQAGVFLPAGRGDDDFLYIVCGSVDSGGEVHEGVFASRIVKDTDGEFHASYTGRYIEKTLPSQAICAVESADRKKTWVISKVTPSESHPVFQLIEVDGGDVKVSDSSYQGDYKSHDTSGYRAFKVSPDGRHLAYSYVDTESNHVGLALYSFDSFTGSISFRKLLPLGEADNYTMLPLEFSSTGQFLYGCMCKVLNRSEVRICIDVDRDNPNFGGVASEFGGHLMAKMMQLAPNENIYSSSFLAGAGLPYVEFGSSRTNAIWKISGDTIASQKIGSGILPTFNASYVRSEFVTVTPVENAAGRFTIRLNKDHNPEKGTSEVTEFGVCSSDSGWPAVKDDNRTEVSAAVDEFTYDLSDMAWGHRYIRPYAVVGGRYIYGTGIVYDVTENLRLRMGAPRVTETTVSLDVEAGGYEELELSECGICFARGADPTIEDKTMPADLGDEGFTAEIANLVPGVTYHLRAYLRFGENVFYGPEIMVSTLQATKAQSGRLVFPDGAGVEGATVLLSDYRTAGGKLLTSVTDSMGGFYFDAIPDFLETPRFIVYGAGVCTTSFEIADFDENGELTVRPSAQDITFTVRRDGGFRSGAVGLKLAYEEGCADPRVLVGVSGESGEVTLGTRSGFLLYADSAYSKGVALNAAELAGAGFVVRLDEREKVGSLVYSSEFPPAVDEAGRIIINLEADPLGLLTPSNYTARAFDGTTYKAAETQVQLSPDGKRLVITCSDIEANATDILSRGVLLRVVGLTGETVFNGTWRSSDPLDGMSEEIPGVVKELGAQHAETVRYEGDGVKPGQVLEVYVPEDGLDYSQHDGSGCGGDRSAYLELNIHRIGDAVLKERTRGSFSSLAEVNVNFFDCGEPVNPDEEIIRDLEITMPYDAETVSPEALRTGAFVIYHSENLQDFKELKNMEKVDPSDIIAINPEAGTVSFRVRSLSVFGIGSEASLGLTAGSGGGCVVADSVDSTLLMLFLGSVLTLVVRRFGRAA